LTNNRESGDAFNTDILTDPTARGSAYTKDYQLTGSDLFVVSPRLVNDLRFQASTRRVVSRSGETNGAGIEIVGLARFGRPIEANLSRHERREQFVDNVSFLRARDELKTGVTINHVSLRDDDQTGFGGVYIFCTFDDFLAARPAVWRQAFGTSPTRFGVTNLGGFAQDQWRATPHLTFNLGARYDVERLPQPFRTYYHNISPRLGAAYSPANNTVVRADFGLYYDRLPLAFLNRAIQKNGTNAFEQVAFDTTATQVFAATGGGSASAPIAGITPSIFRADSRFVTPYSEQANSSKRPR
jgi:outer membrane receptor protein involved in Fe transport